MTLDNKVVYVSGPVTGRDYAEVCRDFADARTWLRAHGVSHVTTPTRLVSPGLGYNQAMRECIHEITKRDYDVKEGGLVRRPWYDMIVLLDGWEASDGATLESMVAKTCGIEVVTLSELQKEVSSDD